MLLISWLRLRCTRRVLLPALLLGALGAAAGAGETEDLPTLPGYDRASARDLNNGGKAVGQALRTDFALPRQAILWSKRWSKRSSKGTTVEPLPTLDGMVDGDGAAIADSGIPVGTSSIRVGNSTFFRAVIWKKVRGEWEAAELEPPPGYTDAIAADVNSRGQAVGWAFNPNEIVNGDVVRRAVIWQPVPGRTQSVVVLDTPEGFQSTATGINDLGDVVGRAYRTEVGDTGTFERSDTVVWRRVPQHHGLHDPGHSGSARTPVVLPSAPGLPRNTTAAINLFGHVVATATGLLNGTQTTRPVFWKRRLWKKGGPAYENPVVLPVPEGFTDASGADINVVGEVVGSAFARQGGVFRGSSAVLWTLRHSGWTDEVLDSPEGATFVVGTRLNDSRSFVGNDLAPPAGSSGAFLSKRGGNCSKPGWKGYK